jgi:hypothetical protein
MCVDGNASVHTVCSTPGYRADLADWLPAGIGRFSLAPFVWVISRPIIEKISHGRDLKKKCIWFYESWLRGDLVLAGFCSGDAAINPFILDEKSNEAGKLHKFPGKA